MRLLIVLVSLLVGDICLADYAWKRRAGGTAICVEVTPNGGFIRSTHPQLCREKFGMHFAWRRRAGGVYICNEVTPEGYFVRSVHQQLCHEADQNRETRPPRKPRRDSETRYKDRGVWRYQSIQDPRDCKREGPAVLSEFSEEIPVCEDQFLGTVQNKAKQKLSLFCSSLNRYLSIEFDLSRETNSRDFKVIQALLESGEDLVVRLEVDGRESKSVLTWTLNETLKTLTSPFLVEEAFLQNLRSGYNLKIELILSSSSFSKKLIFGLKGSGKALRQLARNCY